MVLASGRGSNLQAILDAIHEDCLDARVALVLCNRPDAEALQRAAAAGVPTLTLDHRAFADRGAFDQAMIAAIDPHAPDLVVLAGFMRLLTPGFVAHYAGRLVNIHPSLLPAYPGLDTHRRVLEGGDHRHGATVHFVTSELDSGPAIVQGEVPVLPGDTPATLAARVLVQEHLLYPLALQWLCSGRVTLRDGRVCLDGESLATEGLRINALD